MTVELRGIAKNHNKEEVQATGTVFVSLLLYHEDDEATVTVTSPRKRVSAKELEKITKKKDKKNKKLTKKSSTLGSEAELVQQLQLHANNNNNNNNNNKAVTVRGLHKVSVSTPRPDATNNTIVEEPDNEVCSVML